MITISLTGGRHHAAVIKNAAHFYIKTLIPRIRKLRLKIEIIDGLACSEQSHGDCWQCGHTKNGFDYIVRIDRDDSIYHMLSILAHECVHIKQYLRRELVLYVRDTGCARWKGIFCEEYDYYSAPWELEADALENKLYTRFIEYYK